ncbi:MAG: hypothetical protein M1825_003765 [Sarcosagium campestre]|nr:MAG: hypothetical protein M1825_003765 [Sarcosagium campestre]
MQYSILLSSLASLAAVSAQGVTGKLGDALVVSDNPQGIEYTATLPDSEKNTVRGFIKAIAGPGGKGLDYTVELSGLPDASLGPFLYHVHDQPVPEDGNCTKTLAHLDPTERGEDPPCDTTAPKTCQVGDLSGKFGKITASPFKASYNDLYTATKPGLGAFIGNRSVVVHYANKTRITCANFVASQISPNSSNITSPGTGATPGTTSPTAPLFEGSASTVAVSMSVALAGIVAAFFV